MPMWRCPHCGTPQSETSRCWVCKRSSTSCGTCRHFRKSIAGHLGYCGLDPRRVPIRGDEMRGCWEAGPLLSIVKPARTPAARAVSPGESDAAPAATSGRRDFIPVGPAPRVRARRAVRSKRAATARSPDLALGFWADEA